MDRDPYLAHLIEEIDALKLDNEQLKRKSKLLDLLCDNVLCGDELCYLCEWACKDEQPCAECDNLSKFQEATK